MISAASIFMSISRSVPFVRSASVICLVGMNLILMSGCRELGQRLNLIPDDDVGEGNSVDISKLMLFEVEDQNCQSQKSSVRVDQSKAWIWNGQSVDQQTVTLNGNNGTEGALATSAVVGSVYGYQSSTECTFDGATTCQGGQVVGEVKVLHICRGDGNYRRDSFESVALTTQYILDRARFFYQSIVDAKSSIKPSLSLIHPIAEQRITIKKDGRKVNVVDSDNAAFTSSNDSSFEYTFFLVYPTSKENFALTGLNLWEVPFVMSHEYGHAVFLHYVGAAANASGVDLTPNFDVDWGGPLGGFSVADSTQISGSKFGSNQRSLEYRLTNRTGMALRGVNELFADLFGSYVNGSAPNLLKGVDCLDVSRDLTSDKTIKGQVKQWTAEASRIYAGEGEPISRPDRSFCGEPSFAGEHDVALMLGFPIGRFLISLFPTATSEVRASVLLSWADQIKNHIASVGEGVTVDSLTKLLIQVSMQRSSLPTVDKSQACSLLRPLISGLPESSAACI